ncbi:MAG: DUF4177 domain-containing protein [Deltaproteobacteria bacterium]|nr:DUF4177 domain-containing protein [Deltaproteobacteria bacterium]
MSEAVEYKVVEVSAVTEEELTQVLNEWVANGWRFDGMQFAMRESSRRPSMAFVLFTRPLDQREKPISSGG